MKTSILYRSLWVAAMLVPALYSCDDYMKGDFPINVQGSLAEKVSENPNLSLFDAIIEQGDLRGMVHAYGTYTLFAPTNEAVEQYLGVSDEASALSAIQALSPEEARYMVKYHMVNDTIKIKDLVDTRLAAPNMETDYLISAYKYDEQTNENYYVINRSARIVDADDHAGNGILHVINGFLSRPDYSVKDVFNTLDDENNPYAAGFSTMVRLMKEICSKEEYGIQLDSIVPAAGSYVTFLAQSNEVMEAEDLTSFDNLLAKLQKNNISGYTDKQLLENWIGYHFLKGRYFKADFTGSLNTYAPLGKVITVTALNEQDVYLNRFDAYDEDGLRLAQSADLTDFICANGVIQVVEGSLEIIERPATRINWDFADQPEIRALKIFRKGGNGQYFYSTNKEDENGYVPTDLSMMTWSGKNSPNIEYYCLYTPTLGTVPFDNKSEYVYGDYLRFRLGTTVIQYLEFKTPTLVGGTKYKVWVRYRREGKEHLGFMHMVFKQDGQEDQVFGTQTLAAYGPNSTTRESAAQDAAKGKYAASGYIQSSVITAVCVGTIDVINDGVHTIRMVPDDANSSVQSWDMFYFIPVDLDQVFPFVQVDGNDARVYKVVDYDADGKPVYDRSVYWDLCGQGSSEERTHIFPQGQCDVVLGKKGIGECPYTWCPNHDPAKFVEE